MIKAKVGGNFVNFVFKKKMLVPHINVKRINFELMGDYDGCLMFLKKNLNRKYASHAGSLGFL